MKREKQILKGQIEILKKTKEFIEIIDVIYDLAIHNNSIMYNGIKIDYKLIVAVLKNKYLSQV